MINLLHRKEDSDDFALKTFNSVELPRYAILSHTWNDGEEVSYDELLAGTGKHKAGYDKIRFCAEKAAEDGIEYFWVDTCCIDKRSSSELQEAINSMFKWYSEAAICYVYLSDLTDARSIDGNESQFAQAHWHSRGWTLQELLAPRHVNFYTRDGIFIGTKDTLCKQLSAITRINIDFLNGEVPIPSASVAQRMSWASRRETSRPEDTAYCLMGIFSVNMTMLYGEGKKAFIRLQEEICKDTSDHSIFAWQDVDRSVGYAGYGLLAEHPCQFRHASAVFIVSFTSQFDYAFGSVYDPIIVVNQAIKVNTHLRCLGVPSPHTYILVLNCRFVTAHEAGDGQLGILVERRQLPGYGWILVRIMPDILTSTKHLPNMTEKLMLAKAGSYSSVEHEPWEELRASPYQLLPERPEGHVYVDQEFWAPGMAPVYILKGSCMTWHIIAWTTSYLVNRRLQPDQRRVLGRMRFRRNDGEEFVVELAISRRDDKMKLFDAANSVYEGEASWVGQPGPRTWSPIHTRVDCGRVHTIWAYGDQLSESRARKGFLFSAMKITFLIRIEPFRLSENTFS